MKSKDSENNNVKHLTNKITWSQIIAPIFAKMIEVAKEETSMMMSAAKRATKVKDQKDS